MTWRDTLTMLLLCAKAGHWSRLSPLPIGIAKNPLKDDLSNEQDSDEVATKHRPVSRVPTKVMDEDPNERIKRQGW